MIKGMERTVNITVGVMGERPVFRLGLSSILELMNVGRVVLEADGPVRLQQGLAAGPVPLVLVLQWSCEEHASMRILDWLGEHYPFVRVLVIADKMSSSERLLRAGAHGVLGHRPTRDTLCEAVRTVATGRVYRGPDDDPA